MKAVQKSVVVMSLLVAMGSMAAEAAQIRVKCERRADRSVISVDGRGLAAGQYTASVSSAANSADAPALAAVGGEVEFDFASNANDIAGGAAAIPTNFIQGTVTAKILSADGFTVVSDTVTCRVR